MPSLLDILTHTPPVVWGALALLVLFGVRQMRTQTMSAGRVWLVPVVVGAASRAGALRGSAGAGELLTGACWAVGAALGFASNCSLEAAAPRERTPTAASPWRQHRAAAAVLGVFLVRYVVNVALAIQPTLSGNPEAAAAAAIAYGLTAGLLAARSRKIWSTRRRRPAWPRRLRSQSSLSVPRRPPPPCLPRTLPRPPRHPARPAAPHLLRHGAKGPLANMVIAGLIATVNGGRFGHTLVYAESIGLSIWLLIELGRRLAPARTSGWPRRLARAALVGAGCALGYVIGDTVADALFGYSSWHDYATHPPGCCATSGRRSCSDDRRRRFWARGQARAQRAQVAAAAHEATLARLNLLQSQLEPHMLFNTLADLRALIVADPPRAQEMLDHLIAFLRATLDASRQSRHPLADEFARIDDYLALMKVRMGDRLRASSALPPTLASIAVPPLLLQPLVENAIKHGLEPQRGPGELHVSATVDGTTLILAVADSGRGLEAAAAARSREPVAPGSGFGLAQVRERLQTLHGDAASFTLAPRADGGTLAEIRLPIVTRPS